MRRKKRDKAVIKRFIVVGLDGQDPRNSPTGFMARGQAAQLPEAGRPGLATTVCARRIPSISPVAWSSFGTGTEPAKHNIFDFLDRDKRTYLPQLSSTAIGTVKKFFKLGRWRIPHGETGAASAAVVPSPSGPSSASTTSGAPSCGCRSPFRRTTSTVPSSPPCACPDLLGTQGTFLLFTTRQSDEKFKEGGLRFTCWKGTDRGFTSKIRRSAQQLPRRGAAVNHLPSALEVDKAAKKRAKLDHRRRSATSLELGKSSATWITLTFPAAPMVKVTGICRMQLTEADEHVSLYVTPICPGSRESGHAGLPPVVLRHLPGQEDRTLLDSWGWRRTPGPSTRRSSTTAPSCKQSYDIDREREEMLFAALDKLRFGTPGLRLRRHRPHPAHVLALHGGRPSGRRRHRRIPSTRTPSRSSTSTTMPWWAGSWRSIEEGDVLLVISDHGFSSFRRGVNLNAWLLQEGYLKLKGGGRRLLRVAAGRGLEPDQGLRVGPGGHVSQHQRPRGARHRRTGRRASPQGRDHRQAGATCGTTRRTRSASTRCSIPPVIHQGDPTCVNAPDFIIGYNAGYRTSWDCATGMVSGPIFEDNVKAWSGDHCVDPRLVPGVIFANHALDARGGSLASSTSRRRCYASSAYPTAGSTWMASLSTNGRSFNGRGPGRQEKVPDSGEETGTGSGGVMDPCSTEHTAI